MHSAIEELKTRAQLRLRAAKAGDTTILARFAQLPSLREIDEEQLPEILQLKHALWLVAREVGFSTWKQAQSVLSGGSGNGDFGTLLGLKNGQGYLNNWYARYEEARECLEQTGGYLLVWKTQFLVVEADYIRGLGLDPDDPDWQLIGNDWAKPRDFNARNRLYAGLIKPVA